MMLSDVIRDVADLADRVWAYYEVESPKRHPRYPLIYPGEPETPPPPEEAELERRLAALPADTLYRVMLVLYLGRGTIGPADLAAKYDELAAEWTDLSDAAGMVAAEGALGDVLRDGLDELRRHGVDVDHLPVPAASPG